MSISMALLLLLVVVLSFAVSILLPAGQMLISPKGERRQRTPQSLAALERRAQGC
jgi:hypothetical protein